MRPLTTFHLLSLANSHRVIRCFLNMHTHPTTHKYTHTGTSMCELSLSFALFLFFIDTHSHTHINTHPDLHSHRHTNKCTHTHPCRHARTQQQRPQQSSWSATREKKTRPKHFAAEKNRRPKLFGSQSGSAAEKILEVKKVDLR